MYFPEKKLWLFLILFLVPFLMTGFEGKIKMVRKTFYDTNYIDYYVKGNQVRVERYSKGEDNVSSLIIDINSMKVFLLDSKRKKYTQLTVDEDLSNGGGNYKIIKTKNFREINGVKCYQWRVRNREQNSEVAFWVARKDLDFFNKLIPILSQIDGTYFFYEKIQGKSNFFPFMIVERNLLRKEKKRLAVVDIQRTSVSDYLFKIPSNYQEVKR